MRSAPPAIPLPRGWPARVKSAFLCAIALAHRAMIAARAQCESSKSERERFLAKIAGLETRLALLEQQNRLLHSRLSRVPAHKRPHYLAEERLDILAFKAAMGLSIAELAEYFLVTALTITSWTRRVDEEGEAALLRMREPVNRFPDLVRQLVHKLKETCPAMGRTRIAQMLARAGLQLAPSTVRRMLRKPLPAPQLTPPPEAAQVRRAPVRARRVHHTWHTDMTIVPSALGFAVPWIPGCIAQRWPFCWWLCIVLDHFSRAVVHAGVFRKEPTAAETCTLLDEAIAIAGAQPKYIVSDQGCEFREEYRDWCAARGIIPRFGAMGQHGAIAVLERFMKTLKEESLRRILVPLGLSEMHAELASTVIWYNTFRPHQSLRGATPAEIRDDVPRACDKPSFETRPRYPLRRSGRARAMRRRARAPLQLVVGYVDGRMHLPIISLERAA